jgi:hypothetical protein
VHFPNELGADKEPCRDGSDGGTLSDVHAGHSLRTDSADPAVPRGTPLAELLDSGIHSSLLKSISEVEAGEPVAEVFSSWPKDWDAAFTLLARGAFLVSSSMEEGQIAFVQIESLAGGECRLRNPWPDKSVTIYRGKEQVREQSGSVLTPPMRTGETLLVAPENSAPSRKDLP